MSKSEEGGRGEGQNIATASRVWGVGFRGFFFVALSLAFSHRCLFSFSFSFDFLSSRLSLCLPSIYREGIDGPLEKSSLVRRCVYLVVAVRGGGVTVEGGCLSWPCFKTSLIVSWSFVGRFITLDSLLPRVEQIRSDQTRRRTSHLSLLTYPPSVWTSTCYHTPAKRDSFPAAATAINSTTRRSRLSLKGELQRSSNQVAARRG